MSKQLTQDLLAALGVPAAACTGGSLHVRSPIDGASVRRMQRPDPHLSR